MILHNGGLNYEKFRMLFLPKAAPEAEAEEARTQWNILQHFDLPQFSGIFVQMWNSLQFLWNSLQFLWNLLQFMCNLCGIHCNLGGI